MDLTGLTEKDVRGLGVNKEADVRRATALVQRLQQEHRTMSLEMDALYIDPDEMDIKTWLEKRGLGEYLKIFEKHRVDFEVLGDLTYDDIKEMGVGEIGPRRKIFRAISVWRDERNAKKTDAIISRMQLLNAPQAAQPPSHSLGDVAQRLTHLRQSLSFKGV